MPNLINKKLCNITSNFEDKSIKTELKFNNNLLNSLEQ